MFWPRLQLTAEEKQYVSKYFDPESKYTVKRRMYSGFLTLTNVQRQPTFGFQIARRVRVFGMTASGDLTQFRIQLQSSSGEQYLPDAIAAPNLFGGYNLLQPSAFYPPVPFTKSVGFPITFAPYIFEPNIVLDPNQILNLLGQGVMPFAGTNYRMDVVFHVWEFPGMYGTSPT